MMFSKYASVFLKFFRRNLNFFLGLKYVFATVLCSKTFTPCSAFSFLLCSVFKAGRACVVKISQNKLFLQHRTPGKRHSMRYQSLPLFNYESTCYFYNAKGNKVVQPLQNPVFLQRLAVVQSCRTCSYGIMLYISHFCENNYNIYSCPDLW